MSASSRFDIWANGAAYDRYVGRWSRLVARDFLAWLAVPTGRRWLDVGCGAGALGQTILATAAPTAVVGVDSSTGFIAYARRQAGADQIRFAAGDARALPLASATFDMVVSGLVLNFVPEPATAVAEMARVLRPGGGVAVYVWDYAGEMQFMRRFWEAAGALDPVARALDEGQRFSVCQPAPLTALFQAAGLTAIDVRPIDTPTRFRDFDDYWLPFLGGQGSAPGYVASLSEAQRAALRERVRASLPIAADGSISLIARAWAIRGSRST
jgi:SAM-dependent methyltransferase